MNLISEETKIKSRNGRLYFCNTLMAITISSVVFASSIPAGGAIIWLLLDSSRLTKCAKALPEWKQFIKIGNLEQFTPEINFLFYASLIFAIAVTAITILVFYNS
jgi:uncharacterized membrane protein YidH (DUF202 family)